MGCQRRYCDLLFMFCARAAFFSLNEHGSYSYGGSARRHQRRRAMTPPQASSDPTVRPETCYWSSIDTAQAYADFSDPHDPPFSQRQYANEHGIPRSTLGYWLRQQFPDHLDPEVVDFFRRPVGHNFLRRLVGSTLLVFHHQHPCGLRAVGQFLELAELDYFVGSSYGALYSLDKRLQQNLLLFGQEERSRLAAALAATGVVKD